MACDAILTRWHRAWTWGAATLDLRRVRRRADASSPGVASDAAALLAECDGRVGGEGRGLAVHVPIGGQSGARLLETVVRRMFRVALAYLAARLAYASASATTPEALTLVARGALCGIPLIDRCVSQRPLVVRAGLWSQTWPAEVLSVDVVEEGELAGLLVQVELAEQKVELFCLAAVDGHRWYCGDEILHDGETVLRFGPQQELQLTPGRRLLQRLRPRFCTSWLSSSPSCSVARDATFYCPLR